MCIFQGLQQFGLYLRAGLCLYSFLWRSDWHFRTPRHTNQLKASPASTVLTCSSTLFLRCESCRFCSLSEREGALPYSPDSVVEASSRNSRKYTHAFRYSPLGRIYGSTEKSNFNFIVLFGIQKWKFLNLFSEQACGFIKQQSHQPRN